MLAVEGIPVFYLELAVGQRLRKGAIGSFRSPLPWSECPKEYYANGSYRIVRECAVSPMVVTSLAGKDAKDSEKSSPTEYFWYRETLEISQDISHPERFNWKIAVCLLVAWFLTYLCMAKGIASSGKVI
ncbi:Sodium-dependent neutral amino acid transporter Slc6A17-like [Homarus americanus]|uniref:Sodium-dependent neutral amino acid transporter Slc6A17-like n=1 Tax=Homarus americanus TaxID=6706 RepID=A0A8J5JBU1_HOMAM|nr:Sodium-dependent neutral amino acid transporter Slc6A17-like [Homarus americanus]